MEAKSNSNGKKKSVRHAPRVKSTTGPCFMCKRSDDLCDDPSEGRLATGSMLDYRDTYADGPHAGEFKRIVFRGFVCDMHADDERIVTIRYIK